MSDTTEAQAPEESESAPWSVENVLVILLTAALPMSFASGFTSYEALKQGILLVAGAVLLLVWTTRAIRGQTMMVRGVLSLVPLLVLGLYAATTAIWAINPLMALLESGRWFALLGVVLVVLDPLGRPVPFRHVALALAVGVGGASLVGILQGFGVVIDTQAPYVLADGLRGTFDAERYAAIMIGATLPALAAGVFANRGAGRVVVGIGLALGAFYLGSADVLDAYISVGAGALVAAVIIAVGHGVHGLVPSYGAMGALGVAALLVLAGAYATPMDAIEGELPAELGGTKLERTNFAVDEVDWDRATPPRGRVARNYAAASGLELFSAHAVGGVGGGNYDAAIMGWPERSHPHYQSLSEGRSAPRSAHNSYVQLAAELGVIGFAIFAIFVFLALAVLWQAMRKSAADSDEGQGLPLLHLFGMVGTFMSLLVAFGLEAVLFQSYGALLFAIASAFVMRESFILLDGQGLSKPWMISPQTPAFERFGLAGLLPLSAAVLSIYLGVITVGSDYYQARGDVWLRAGALDKAKEAYRDSIGLFPSNDIAWFQLAEVSAVRGDKGEAEKIVKKAIAMRPYDPRLLTTLGNLQSRLSITRGQTRMKELAEKPPEPPEEGSDGKSNPPNPLSQDAVLSSLDRPTLASAETNFNRAIELHPRYPKAFEGLGNLLVTQKKVGKAISTYLRALDKVPEDDKRLRADMHMRVGQLYSLDEKWVEARRHLNRVLEIYPEHPGRKSIGMDLAEIQARIEGKPLPKQGHQGHGHGGKPPIDVNALREQKRKLQEELDRKKAAQDGVAPKEEGAAPKEGEGAPEEGEGGGPPAKEGAAPTP